MANDTELDKKIDSLEAQLKDLRAQKENKSIESNPQFQKELTKFKKRFAKLRNDYPKTETIEVTATFRIHMINEISMYQIDNWIDTAEVVESNNIKIAQCIIDSFLNDEIDNDDNQFTNSKLLKEYSRLMNDINKSEYKYSIKDALLDLDD